MLFNGCEGMKVAIGRHEYTTGQPPCLGNGYQWSGIEFNDALKGQVIARLFDDEGISSLFASFSETGFGSDRLKQLFSIPDNIEDWQAGESIAEVYLADHRNCLFPCPNSRDIRKEGSILPGADLVGIHKDSKGECLIFGEVKTSRQNKHPPSVMHNMQKQLEDLCDRSIRERLLCYLGFRSKGTSWAGLFCRAVERYLRNDCDVQLFGFLVRDVEPNESDIQGCVASLAVSRPGGIRIEVIALYLPKGKIKDIGSLAVALRQGGRP